MTDHNIIEVLLDRWQDEVDAGRTPDLKRLCADHPDLLPVLQNRIAAFQKMDRGLKKILDETMPQSVIQKDDDSDSGLIGTPLINATVRYRICSKHAKGGLGEVLVAEDEVLGRQVALKRMQGDAFRDPVRRQRFQREAVITGQLDHPGIVAVHSFGEDAAGSPCYAMKFVEGQSLDQCTRALHDSFAHRTGHDLRDRRLFESTVLRPLLSRFVSVCNTIAFAHSRNVIHRDIKPANVMLGDFGATFVVDWGLAKYETNRTKSDVLETPIVPQTNETLQAANSDTANSRMAATVMRDSGAANTVNGDSVATDEDALLDDALTRTGSVMGTPAYMSPEQATGDSGSIGPASDIYSLGATLYFILTGRAAIASSPDMNWIDQVRRGQFPRPREVQPLIQEALESVCLKAMATNSSGRYSSAVELSADVERWLADEPVSTATETLPEKFARFTRHHRAATLMFFLATIVIAVIASVASLLINSQKNIAQNAEEESRRAAIAEKLAKEAAELSADAERLANEKAQRRLVQVERANSTLASVFENLDPAEIAKNEEPLQVLLVREIEKAIGALDSDSISDTLVVAELQNKLGKSLLSLSEPAKAIPVLRQALAAHEAVLGKSHAETISCQSNLAEAYQQSGDLAHGIPLLEEALALARASLNDMAPQKSAAMNNLGSAYLEAGRIPEAIALFEEALSLRKQHLGSKDAKTVLSMNDLAQGYSAAGKRDESLALLQDVAQLTSEIHGPDDPRAMSGANNLAIALFSVGRTKESLPLFEETLKRRKAALGREHIDTLGSMNNLAANYQAQSMWSEAILLLEEAESLTAKKFGELHPGHLFTMNNLGFVHLQMNQPDKAVPILERTLELRQKSLGDDHPDTSSTRLNLGLAQIAVGNPDVGLPFLEAAFMGRLTKLGIQHPKTIESLLTATTEYQKAERTSDADRLFLQAIAAVPEADRRQSVSYAQLLAGFGSHYLQLKRWAEAEPILRECLAIRQELQPDAVNTFSTQSMLGESLLGQKKFADAEQPLLDGYQGLKAREHQITPQQSNRIPEAIDRLIRYFEETSQPEKAEYLRAERGK